MNAQIAPETGLDNVKRLPTPEQIEKVIADVFEIPHALIRQAGRGRQPIPWARQLAMHFIMQYRIMNQKKVSEWYGKDHSCVSYANNLICAIAEQEGPQREEYERCCMELGKIYQPVPRINNNKL